MEKSSSENKIIEEPVLDPAGQKRAREYSGIRRRLSLGEIGFTLVILLILIFTGITRWFTGLFNWSPVSEAVIFFLVLIVAFEILSSPLSYYSGFVLPHRYGLSKQILSGWLSDVFKSGAISLIFGTAAVAVGYWLLWIFPNFWWLLAWVLILIITLLLSIIAPVLLVPLFYKVKPLTDIELKARLEHLAEKAGAKVHGIFILDFSTKFTSANAGLMGLGKTRRIVISDTLIQQYSVPEIEVVTAHEIGHHMHRDIYRLFIIQSAVYLVVLKLVDVVLKTTSGPLGFSGISDPAALPWMVLLFAAFGALASPLMNAYTRHVEKQADAYALNITTDPISFTRAMTRLVNQNLAVASPPQWEEFLFYDHPSYNKRVKLAQDYQKSKENS